MSTDPVIKDLLLRNKHIASTHGPIPLLSELPALGVPPPKTVIVTCLDPRFVPEKILGLGPAEAGVIRNVGGHVGPALESLLVVDHLFGIERVLVIHHTDCGSLTFTNEEVRNALRARVPNVENVECMEFGAITDLEQSVRDDLAALKRSRLIRKEVVDNSYGFVFDIKTGVLTAVEA